MGPFDAGRRDFSMTNPSGKRRRLRRPNQSSRFLEDGENESEPVEGQPPTAVVGSISTCQRCALPIVSDVCSLTIRTGSANPQTADICGPCADSLNRWLTRSQRDSSERSYERIADQIDADRGRKSGSGSRSRSKSKATDVVDSLHTKRRGRSSDDSGRFDYGSRRTILITVAGSMLALAGLATLVGAIAFLTINAPVSARR